MTSTYMPVTANVTVYILKHDVRGMAFDADAGNDTN